MLKTLPLLFLFSITSMASEVSELCGAPAGWLPNLFSDLEKTRVKCVNDFFDRKQKEKEAEIARILEIHKQMQAELLKTAYKVEYSRVLCHNPINDSFPKKKTKKCHEIVLAQNALLARVDELNGWERKVQKTAKPDVKNKDLNLPCPTQGQLNDMRAVRYFNKGAHDRWTQCVLDGMIQ